MRVRAGTVPGNEYYAHLTRPTLDGPFRAELNSYEKFTQRPANPEILFDSNLEQIQSCAGLRTDQPATFIRHIDKGFHAAIF